MRKFKVGDKVRLNCKYAGGTPEGCYVPHEMKREAGSIVTLRRYNTECDSWRVSSSQWSWPTEFLEPVWDNLIIRGLLEVLDEI